MDVKASSSIRVFKELEIIKQLYDIAILIDAHDAYTSYIATVTAERAYRGLPNFPEKVSQDTIDVAACIASRWRYLSNDYPRYLKGIREIVNNIYGKQFKRLSCCKENDVRVVP
jgi:hypothetical protein